VDQAGNVYVAGPEGGVLIINPAGEHLGSFVAGQRTANAAFGDDGYTLYITSNTNLLRVRLSVKGVGF
jgi:gluconolactonase